MDLNGDGKITSDDSCTDGCFLGHDVANGLIVTGTVPFGEAVYDIATLTGTANQPGTNGLSATYLSINATTGLPANGTITFTLVGPDDCTTEATLKEEDGPRERRRRLPEVRLHAERSRRLPLEGRRTPARLPEPTSGPVTHNDDCTEVGEDVTVVHLGPDPRANILLLLQLQREA